MSNKFKTFCLHPALIVVAVVGAMSAAQTVRADPRIESIAVKWRDDVVPRDTVTLPDELRRALAAALGMPITPMSRARDGAFKLRLAQPLTLAAARAAINRVRMTLPIVYVNVFTPSNSLQRPSANDVAQAREQPPVTRLIVKYRDPVVAELSAQNGTLSVAQLAHLSMLAGRPLAHERAMAGGAFVLRLLQSVTFAEARVLASLLEADPSIEYADPDGRIFASVVPNDTRYPEQWNYQSPTLGPPLNMGGVNLPFAWNLTTGSSNVYVAVLDTGILPHPDLAGRYEGGYDMVSDPVAANDSDPPFCTLPGAACSRDADPTDPGDWIDNADIASGNFPGCPRQNSTWHGTHVSGTVAALTNNNEGVAGVNWVSKVVPVRVLGKCGGTFSDLIDATTWAYGGSVPGVSNNLHPARVLNMSLGGASECITALQDAITNAVAAGSVIAVAAGNSATDAGSSTPGNCNGVITVAAVGLQGQRANYSNYGPVVEIAAPGGDAGAGVLSTLNNGSTTANPNGYSYVNYMGTSMATPHVAGIASLLLSINPNLTPAQVLAIIQTSARAFPTSTGGADCNTSGTTSCGAGIIDASAATAAVQPFPALAYTPLEPCRILDTRIATPGSGVQGPVAGGAVKQLPAFIAAGSNWGQYGGANSSDCGLTNPPGTSIHAIAIVISILNPNFDAYLGIGDANDLTTVLSNVALNFTHGQGLSTTYIVPRIQSNNLNFALPAGVSAQLIFDVVGYFVVPDATPLQCTSQSSATTTVAASGGTGGATSPACSAGYTLISGGCNSTSSSMSLVQDEAIGTNTTWFCSAINRGGAAAGLTATANCCRISGR
ncbi:MAG: S8 family peptidase [Casimicrobiaceae bacterium]